MTLTEFSTDADRIRGQAFSDVMLAKRCRAVLDRLYREDGIVSTIGSEAYLWRSWEQALTDAATARREMADHMEGR